MIEQDTVKLLRECDAGIKMGVASIEEVLGFVSDKELKRLLGDSKSEHNKLMSEIEELLNKYRDEGKSLSPMAKGMAHIKTSARLIINESDKTIADLMTDGCNMGIKTLNRYLNQYKAADEKSKCIAKRLVRLEEKLVEDIRGFL